MTVDERIEALTARHEALAQSLELLASLHRDLETAINARMDKLLAAIETLTGHMQTLARVMLQQERPLRHLEGN